MTRALEEFIARRRQKRLVELMGKLEWDASFDYKAERSRGWPCLSTPVSGRWPSGATRTATCRRCAHCAMLWKAPRSSRPPPVETTTDEPPHRKAARYVWALLLARIYEVLPLLCPQCGGEMRIIAFITEAAVIREILGHLGEPTSPPRLLPARGPPLWEMPGSEPGESDPQAQPAPDYEFDQRVTW